MKLLWRDVRDGCISTLPFTPSVLLLGAIWGAAAAPAGIEPLAATVMSAAVYSGSAQFAALPLFRGEELPLILGTLVLSLRFALMSASMAPKLAHLPVGLRSVLAFSLTDETYALATARRGELSPAFLVGSGVMLYISWLTGTIGGVLAGARVPGEWNGPLGSVFPIVFLTIVVLTCTSRTTAVVAILGAILAVAGKLWLPNGWHVVAAGVAASLAGPWLERRWGQ